jgi:hypothetical protein
MTDGKVKRVLADSVGRTWEQGLVGVTGDNFSARPCLREANR